MNRQSATGLERLETALGQLVEQQLDVLALNLDDPVLERAARAATAFQSAGQRLQLILGQQHAGNGGHRLAAASLAFPANTGDAVTFRELRLLADTGIDRLAAIRTMPSRIGREHQPAKTSE